MKVRNQAVSLLTALTGVLRVNHVTSSNIAQGEFSSIGCTTDISSCVPFSTQFGGDLTFEEEIVVPCDVCVSMGEFVGGESVNLAGGINVQGALYFPDETNVNVLMRYMIVEGHLAMHSDKVIDGEPSVTFTMTGSEDYYNFVPNDINKEACVNAYQPFCDVGKKAIVIAGGTLDIKAMPDTCPSWSKLHSGYGVATTPNIPAEDLPKRASDNSPIIGDAFDSSFGAWKSSVGALHSLETTDSNNGTPYLQITKRSRGWQGAYIAFDANHFARLEGDTTYLFSTAVRLTSPSGTPSDCSSTRKNCVSLKLHYVDSAGSYQWITLADDTGSHPDGNWYTFQAAVEFEDRFVDDASKYVMLYVSGPEIGIDIALDNIALVPLPASMLPSIDDPCGDLFVNGDAEGFGTYTYPFTVRGNKDADLSIVEDGDNKYFKLQHRNKPYTSIDSEVIMGCIQEYSVYELSARVFVDSAEPSSIMAKLNFVPEDATEEVPFLYSMLGYCPESSSDIGWVDCKIPFMFLEKHAKASSIGLGFIVSDEEAVVYYDDLHFTVVNHPTDTIVVDGEVSECWGVGADILLTSYSMSPDDDNVNKITAIEKDGEKTVITLENNIEKFTSLEDSEDFAVEVAILSREILFTHDGEDPVFGEDHGGHLMILQTPETPQLLQGVELRGFGQQGQLGRYPIHYHISGNNPGSIIAKNTIRNSNQRCLVIHATHNVTVFENIAYDHFGHCYMVEDGFEQDNVFERNLGAKTKEMPAFGVLSVQESDEFASTYWISNPRNFFIDNVAAGSHDTGFWYEFIEMLRGPSVVYDPYYVINPSTFKFGAFKGQIVHSNKGDGFKFYPNGYFPEEEAVYYDMKCFRNKGDGVLMHNSENLAIDGGIFADNRIQIEVDKQADDVRVSNAVVLGFSDSFQYSTTVNNVASHCPANRPIGGIQLHSYLRFRDSDGYILENIDFINFGEEATGGCVGSSAIDIDKDVRDGHFDAYSTFKNLRFIPDDTPMGVRFNACAIHNQGIKDMAIHDATGSLNPNGDGTPGYIVSNATVMTAFADCIPMEGSCSLYCPNPSDDPAAEVCFRAVNYAISMSESYADLLLEVTNNLTNATAYFEGYFDNMTKVVDGEEVEDVFENFFYNRRRMFTPIVPKGEYLMRFVTPMGEEVWPRIVEKVWETGDNCTNAITNDDVYLSIPPAISGECDVNIIANGDAENGREHWMHTGSSVKTHAGGYLDSDLAISTVTRKGPWQGIGQFLDSRCFKEGDTLEVEAKYRLRDIETNSAYTCDFNSVAYMANTTCPRVSIRTRRLLGDTIGAEVENDYMYPLALPVGPTNNMWNTLYGYFTVTKQMEEANSVFLFLERGKPGSQLIVDDLKVKKVYRGCDDYYHNRDVESGDTRHWENKGHVSIDIFSPGYNSNYALKTVYRDVYWASMMQEIDTSCLNIGMKYTLSSMIRLKVTETGDNWKCNKDIVWGVVWQLWEACPVMTLQYWNGNQTSYQDIGRFEEDFKANEWNELKGDFIASNEIANADKVIVFWNKVQKNYTIIMDDFSIKPSEDLGCNKLIWNGDAEDGNPGYWHSHGSGRVVMHTPGASGSSYAVKAVDRQSPDDGLTHTIDIDCLTPGALYKIEAEIRLFRGTRAVGCNSLTTDDFGSPARCPHLSLYTKTDGVEQSRFVAAIAARWRGRRWNKLTGYFTFMANELEGGMVYIVINKGRPDADIVVDNLSLETVDLINEVEAYHHTVES